MATSAVQPDRGTRKGAMPGDAPRRGGLAALRAAVSDALRWDDASKALLIEALLAPPMLVATLRAWYLMKHPEVEPYLNRDALRVLLWVSAIYLLRLPIVVPLGLVLRRSPRWGRVFAHFVSQIWWLSLGLATYMHGPSTTPLWVLYPTLGLLSLLLFDARVAFSGFVTSLVFLFATAIAGDRAQHGGGRRRQHRFGAAGEVRRHRQRCQRDGTDRVVLDRRTGPRLAVGGRRGAGRAAHRRPPRGAAEGRLQSDRHLRGRRHRRPVQRRADVGGPGAAAASVRAARGMDHARRQARHRRRASLAGARPLGDGPRAGRRRLPRSVTTSASSSCRAARRFATRSSTGRWWPWARRASAARTSGSRPSHPRY